MGKTDPFQGKRGKGKPSGESIVEIYVCPVGGCSRSVIGKPGHLRNHVRHSVMTLIDIKR